MLLTVQFTGVPAPLHIYSAIPSLLSIAPMNGPIYGGFAVDISGSGFINTGVVTVRFELLQEPASEQRDRLTRSSTPRAVAVQTTSRTNADTNDTPVTATPAVDEQKTFVDARAEFVSADRLLCVAPTFPHEGVYMVSVSLNGVEFSKMSASSWFLAWQNWQRRKLLLASHSLFTHPLGRQEHGGADSAMGLAGEPRSTLPLLVDDELDALRRKSSFMLPHSAADAEDGDPRAFGGVRLPLIRQPRERRSSVMRTVMKYYEQIEEDGAGLTDLTLLHWHPASAADEKCDQLLLSLTAAWLNLPLRCLFDLMSLCVRVCVRRGRSLISLLDSLCNAPETQPIMCRRLSIVFRLKGRQLRVREVGDDSSGNADTQSDSDDDGGSSRRLLMLRYSAFIEGLRWIFPHALERELDDLWHLVDRRQRGFITYAKLMKRIVREERSRSPEPGPTHYTPQFSAVEPKPVAATILPEVDEPERTAGLPSELFMDYNAIKAVKPRVATAFFPKGKADASWCNPVAREPLVDGGVHEGADTAVSGADRRPPRTNVMASEKAGGSATLTPRPPKHRSLLRQSGQATPRMGGGRAGHLAAPDRVQQLTSSQSRQGREEASLDPQAQLSNNSKESSTRSPVAAIRVLLPPADGVSAPTLTSAATGTHSSADALSPSSGRSLFYDDIAPLYLRFLKSKEVQKFMKQ